MIKTKKLIIKFLVLFLFAVPALAEEVHDVVLEGDLATLKMLLEKNPVLFHVSSVLR